MKLKFNYVRGKAGMDALVFDVNGIGRKGDLTVATADTEGI
jgi:hypothetical protein